MCRADPSPSWAERSCPWVTSDQGEPKGTSWSERGGMSLGGDKRACPPGVPARTLGPWRALLCLLPQYPVTYLCPCLPCRSGGGGWVNLWTPMPVRSPGGGSWRLTFCILCRSGCCGSGAAWTKLRSLRTAPRAGWLASCRLTRRTTCLPRLVGGGAQPAAG